MKFINILATLNIKKVQTVFVELGTYELLKIKIENDIHLKYFMNSK